MLPWQWMGLPRLGRLDGYSWVFVRSPPEAHVVYVIFDKHFTCTHARPRTQASPKMHLKVKCVCVAWDESARQSVLHKKKEYCLGTNFKKVIARNENYLNKKDKPYLQRIKILKDLVKFHYFSMYKSRSWPCQRRNTNMVWNVVNCKQLQALPFPGQPPIFAFFHFPFSPQTVPHWFVQNRVMKLVGCSSSS